MTITGLRPLGASLLQRVLPNNGLQDVRLHRR